ncbi:hypothetical protein KKC08_05360 [Patescibacteria group bacterium]|nr:hypothetical protein [Patescibacteria group bacterium]MCG2701914.1 hypothetical protein [Candidatus Parcubacteria bacterium]MBU4265191.1 hypothetical protein [Patescibacteria group bacterium]MBU4390755.1 hypothetical protein [Patescibacteria group bacterium]MBU4397566.1 hypothetical protein [Patescibacteria group bacterium]
MKIYIDQSSKIEYTNKNTVIAFSNGHHKSLLIKAKEKRKLEKIFKKINKPKIFVYKTFAILLAILIETEIENINHSFLIDKEYTGKEALIKNYLVEILRKQGKKFDKDQIDFTFVGKKSKCHQIAIDTFRGKLKPDITVAIKKLLKYLL